jgi:uncharacterized protein (DUF433 family)
MMDGGVEANVAAKGRSPDVVLHAVEALAWRSGESRRRLIKPTLRRILRRWTGANITADELLAEYPSLTRGGVRVTLAYAAESRLD